jgi:alpha-galactosidase
MRMRLGLHRVAVLFMTAAGFSSRAATPVAPDFAEWSPTPPMGWNSYTSFGGSVTETEVMANATAMKEKLRVYGWEYVVVDFRWYDPDAIKCGEEGSRRKGDWPLESDAFGRLLPDPVRFPSAAGGKGFKPLADKLHGMGLKFGIHIMRGIPRQAVKANLPIEGSAFKAKEAAATKSLCSWCNDMFGVTDNAAGQAYYDSLFRLYATWGMDFVKVDDLTYPYSAHEVEMVRKAIDRCGRKIVFSTSPGATPVTQTKHVAALANMWRLSPDFWDTWKQLRHQFDLAAAWESAIGNGRWPDLDLLILGHVGTRSVGGPRMTRFTRDEQRMLMTLWCIARSPLMIGADLPKNDAFTDSLFMNKDVLAVNRRSIGNRQLYRLGDEIAWVAGVPDSEAHTVALFNLGELEKELALSLKDVGVSGSCSVRDLWSGSLLGDFTGEFKARIAPHGAGLYQVTPM